ncbi:MAG: hypothetical protein ABUS79_08910 [Pseudomonadota bacterium]
MIDKLGSRLSFFGRVTDDFRREPAWQGEYRVALQSPPGEALYKRDGHFTFSDLAPSPTAYGFRLLDGLYQGRQFVKALPTASPVEIAYDGEDEVHVFTKTVNAVTRQITFDAIPFLPLIRSGALVLGAGGFSTTLAEDLAGVDATTAVLTSVASLGAGTLVRIVRSRCLRAKAGPYYPFPAGTTVRRAPGPGQRRRAVDHDGRRGAAAPSDPGRAATRAGHHRRPGRHHRGARQRRLLLSRPLAAHVSADRGQPARIPAIDRGVSRYRRSNGDRHREVGPGLDEFHGNADF